MMFKKLNFYNNTVVFASEAEAVNTWSFKYRYLSEKIEFAALIYSAFKDGKKIYYTGRTYAGMGKLGFIRPNVVIPFIYIYTIQSLIQRILHKAFKESFIHTHPKPNPGYTYRHHSKEDMFLLRLPGIKAVYVIPYENNEINRQPSIGKA